MVITNQIPSKRVTARARKLRVLPLTPTEIKVWGGKREHIVSMNGTNITCDCEAHINKTNRELVANPTICSHIVAVLNAARS